MLAATTPFLFTCRFGCGKIIYRNEAGEYIEQESRRKHICKPTSAAQLPVRLSRYSGPLPCSFCKTNERDTVKAAIYFKAELKGPTSYQVVCEACSKKIFYCIASSGSDADTEWSHVFK